MNNNQIYGIKTPKNAQKISKDVIVIIRKVFIKNDIAEEVKQDVIRQLKEDGVVMLPNGLEAIVARRDCIFWEDEHEQIH